MIEGPIFNDILFGYHEGTDSGQFRLNSEGFVWWNPDTYRVVNLIKHDIESMTWMKDSTNSKHRLEVRTKDGLFHKFLGFSKQDVDKLSNFIQRQFHITVEEKKVSVSGKNWGNVEFEGNMLNFTVDSHKAFEVCMANVTQTQVHKNTDVSLEFHVDDDTPSNNNNKMDYLIDLSFHVSSSNTKFTSDIDQTPAQVFQDKVLCMAHNQSSIAPVVKFDVVSVVTPRGRNTIEFHVSYLRFQGLVNNFTLPYSNICRLFLLPKYNEPHTCVAISLDPPLRRGFTAYPYIVIQFETEGVVDKKLEISEELLAEKYKDRLEASYKGLIYEVFTVILHGLCGAKVSKAGRFHSSQDGYAVQATLRAEEGLMYPLEKGFFFLAKHPTFIPYKEIEHAVFDSHDGGSAISHYFDLYVKHGDEEVVHMFRNIRSTEYKNLHEFMSGKGLMILSPRDPKVAGQIVTDVVEDDDCDDDDDYVPPKTRMKRPRIMEASDHKEDEQESVAKEDNSGSG